MPTQERVDTWVRRLQRDGYVVLKISKFTNSLPALREEFDDTLRNFPEYQPNPTHYVGGGFGALGNPGSFHNPFVRELRTRCMKAVLPMFKSIANGEKFCQVIDRMLYRQVGKTPTAESWHRDVSPAASGTRVFGGWINLDEENQYLSCARGTHQLPTTGTGFAKLSKQESAHYTQLRKNIKKNLPSDEVVRVPIPPGCILVFSENLIHEVYPAKVKYDMRRLHLGWAIGDTPITASRNLPEQLRTQAAITIKSNQDARIWPRLYWTNHPNKIEELAAQFKPEFREKRVVLSGKRKAEVFTIIPEVLPPPKKPKYNPYSESEMLMYFPNKL